MTEKKKDRFDKKTALKRLCLILAVELFLAAFLVWLFDPFYQYHRPFWGMAAVLDDRDNQMAGTIRNFPYDSILVGSSVAENFDTEVLDREYGCQTLKVIRASGSMADLLYYVEMAEQEQELKNVFWCLDLFAMEASDRVSLYDEGVPRYLHTRTVLDDVPYLYNKEILLEKIPVMLVKAKEGINTGGQAYNWAEGKEFGATKAMQSYERPEGIREPAAWKAPAEYESTVKRNVEALAAQLAAHPEIRFRFLLPPYSMMWWDCAWVNGEEEERFYVLDETVTMLLSFENAEIFFFADNADIVCDLDNYMDMIHYAPAVNQFMLEQMIADGERVTPENWPERLDGMRALSARIHEEEIYRYYPR